MQSTSGDPQENQFLQRGGHGTVDPHLLQAVHHLPNIGKVKATALLEKFGSKDVLMPTVIMYLFMAVGIQAIANASIEELAEVTNRSHAQQLYNFFRTSM